MCTKTHLKFWNFIRNWIWSYDGRWPQGIVTLYALSCRRRYYKDLIRVFIIFINWCFCNLIVIFVLNLSFCRNVFFFFFIVFRSGWYGVSIQFGYTVRVDGEVNLFLVDGFSFNQIWENENLKSMYADSLDLHILLRSMEGAWIYCNLCLWIFLMVFNVHTVFLFILQTWFQSYKSFLSDIQWCMKKNNFITNFRLCGPFVIFFYK